MLPLYVVYAVHGLFPFGENTLAWCDMKQQVIPLLMEFKDILAGENGFLFNLQNAGGMSFWGVFFFFLSSPFSFLVAFVEKADIYFFVNILVLIKLALASGISAWFFALEYPWLSLGFIIFLSVSYGLCGYGLLYYQNLVWLDVQCLFPVVILGFLQTVRGRGNRLFTLALIGVLAVNYYLSYMVLLALILLTALFVRYLVPEESRGKAAAAVGLAAVSALLISGPVWLPSLLQCLRSARTGQSIIETIRADRLFSDYKTTLPVLLCTGIVWLPLTTVKIKKSPKQLVLLEALALTALPLILEPVNKLWHTGSYQAFPVRYGYIPLFLVLWWTAEFLSDSLKRSGKRRSILPALGIIVLAVVTVNLLTNDFEEISSYTHTLWFDRKSFEAFLEISLLTGGTIALSIWLYRAGRVSNMVLSGVILAACLLQGLFHSAVLIGSAANLPTTEIALLQREDTLEDTGLYRVKLEKKFCNVNLLGATGYNTFSHYTSLTDEKLLYTMKKLGYSSYWMEISGCCGTALSDVLLSNKYVLDDELVWHQTAAGNLGYILPKGVLPEKIEEGSRFEIQNQIYQAVTGHKESAFTEYHPIEELRYEIDIANEETLYFDAFAEISNRLREPINDSFKITVNGKTVQESYPDQRRNGIFELGTFENEHVTIEIEQMKSVEALTSFGVYGITNDKLNSFTNELKVRADLQENHGKITGTAWADDDHRILFLSIADTPGIKISVNGNKTTPRIVLDCFLEIPLEKGENFINLCYVPQGLGVGVLLTAFGIVLRLAERYIRLALERTALFLLQIIFCLLMFLVYILPIVIWFTA